ncbi:MAG: hypothetical protein A2W98_08485 [Bacteroidetes bacterium GWF2_33_38]|nr:MAG: hypothetical protein A2W98_08485 [Bacteroidetes bacterium GWF2_33_38]OFY68041.1 MAG: hypothetical protein A2265_06775 [Bacteroidetes bacterium RIFOXYA12_FULL_33_9]OFY91292.1 MAG: hypothetical protein A2236_11100 [Bacteroidetes bacterium RIFOXYA2_FULL_33_7]
MITVHYSNYKSFLDIHSDAIIGYCDNHFNKCTTQLNNYVNTHFGSIITDFESLIKASPETLKEIKEYFDKLTIKEKKKIRNDLNLKTLYGYFVRGGIYFSSNKITEKYNSKYLANKIDIFTCPYCNENYTYSFEYKKRGNQIRRTFDWDHIYSKKDYPFFAISFFNLVPACKVCNQIKLDQNKKYFNPHLSVNVDDVYFYDINPIDAGFISDTSKLQLNIIFKDVKYKDEIKETISVVAQLNRFRCHKELIKDILNKKRIYTDTYLAKLKNQNPILKAISIGELKKTIYGVYFDHKDYYKRPFSKLTSDILKNRYV